MNIEHLAIQFFLQEVDVIAEELDIVGGSDVSVDHSDQ